MKRFSKSSNIAVGQPLSKQSKPPTYSQALALPLQCHQQTTTYSHHLLNPIVTVTTTYSTPSKWHTQHGISWHHFALSHPFLTTSTHPSLSTSPGFPLSSQDLRLGIFPANVPGAADRFEQPRLRACSGLQKPRAFHIWWFYCMD